MKRLKAKQRVMMMKVGHRIRKDSSYSSQPISFQLLGASCRPWSRGANNGKWTNLKKKMKKRKKKLQLLYNI